MRHRWSLPLLSVLFACNAATTDGVSDSEPLAAKKGKGTPTSAPSSQDPGPNADHGAPSDTYPAFTTGLPQIKNNGGTVLGNPRIVTVTWSSDANAAAFEKFGDEIGGSQYWQTAVGEYGVGPAAGGSDAHVRMDGPPPAATTDEDLEALIGANVKGAPASGWPVWTDQTIYLLYVPEGVAVTTKATGKDACADSEGYHTEISVGSKQVVYAIVNENCHDMGQDVLAFSTTVASHELGEASTNPHVQGTEAWDGFDDDHSGYELFQTAQSEDGDACEFFDDSTYVNDEASFGFSVQRMWSNQSAAAGHNPCVPTNGKPYFNMAPQKLDSVSVLMPDHSHQTTRGMAVPVGSTRTIALGFASDAATDAWTIAAVEGDGFSTPSKKHLAVSLDKTSGQNGEIAYLTVTAKSAGAQRGVLVTIVSTGNGVTRYMPILVQTN